MKKKIKSNIKILNKIEGTDLIRIEEKGKGIRIINKEQLKGGKYV